MYVSMYCRQGDNPFISISWNLIAEDPFSFLPCLFHSFFSEDVSVEKVGHPHTTVYRSRQSFQTLLVCFFTHTADWLLQALKRAHEVLLV